jgi:hypothetical protein
VKYARHKRTNTVRFHLHNIPREVKLMETESRIVVDEAEGKKK